MNDQISGIGSKGVDDGEDFSMGVQVINENKEFSEKLPSYLSYHSLLASGFNYHLVAVFGSQSTGKSTLLNYLFGTHFSVMDETARRQTTKGIWMSKAKPGQSQNGKTMADNILVMDVEGTDGRERGEDQDFERKSALFALATSEVMIVNVWEHQVGLYQGANMGLLKTVFEVNLQLFQKNQSSSQRSLLFFVIRDHIGTTPLQGLADTLMADLNRIWSTLSKPQGLENSQITDFFDFEFAALPHKILQGDKFVEETKKLATRFREVEEESAILSGKKEGGVLGGDTGIFLPSYHRRIPADGLPMYAEGIWTQIVTNKDLDLPSQQELLAQYRCEEISAAITASVFDPLVTPFEEQGHQAAKVLEGLGEAIVPARQETLSAFSVEAGRYFKPVFLKKKEELEKKLDGRLKALVILHYQGLHKRAVQEFEDSVTAYLKKAAASSSASEHDFRETVEEAKKVALSRFLAEAEPCVIADQSWSSFKEELAHTEADIDAVASRVRGEEIRRLRLRIERVIKSKLAEPIELEFRKLSGSGTGAGKSDGKKLWDGVWAVFEKISGEGLERFLSKAQALNASPEENENAVWKLKKKSWAILKAKIDEELMEGNILMKLRENFEDRFRYDENGVPRVWKPSDDIEGLYARARESTLLLIPLLSKMQLSATSKPPPVAEFIGKKPHSFIATSDDEDDDVEFDEDVMVILTDAKQVGLQDRFRKMADGIYVEAKRSTISSVSQIPIWFYGLLVILGWNEFWAVLRSPLYFMFLLLIGAGAYVAHTLNLWGPMVRIGNAMLNQTVEIGREQLRNFVESSKAPSLREEVPLQNLTRSGTTETRKSEAEDEEW